MFQSTGDHQQYVIMERRSGSELFQRRRAKIGVATTPNRMMRHNASNHGCSRAPVIISNTLSWNAGPEANCSQRVGKKLVSRHCRLRGAVTDVTAATTTMAVERSSRSARFRTAREMVVHHPDGLHERVADRRTDETKAALSQVAAHRHRFRRRRRNLLGAAAPLGDGLAAD